MHFAPTFIFLEVMVASMSLVDDLGNEFFIILIYLNININKKILLLLIYLELIGN